jgi:hypothetical protein
MKRIVAGIIAFLYLAIASGIGISIHYCMGNKTGVDYSYQSDRQCHRCGMDNKQGCCHDEYKIVKISDDQQVAKVNLAFQETPFTDGMQFNTSFSLPIQGRTLLTSGLYQSPPDPRTSSIYRFTRAFRI